MYVIYALVDPRDSTVRYVGITDDVYKRFLQHITCDSSNFAKNAWIVELRAANRMVFMEILEEVDDRAEAEAREFYWIKHFEHMKEPILNIRKISAHRPQRRDVPRIARAKKDVNIVADANAVTDKDISAVLDAYAELNKGDEPITRTKVMRWLHDNVSITWNNKKWAIMQAVCDEYDICPKEGR